MDKQRLQLIITLNVILGIGIIYFISNGSFESGRQAGRVEATREHQFDIATLRELIANVEAVRTRLGYAPKDEKELVALMGKSMPSVHDGEHLTPVSYRRTGDNSYRLRYELWATDDWNYDSTKPEAGWVQSYY